MRFLAAHDGGEDVALALDADGLATLRSALSDALTGIVAEDAPGRNDPCPCGSGSKYKKCCGR
jgi:preprotein translocase subunit SecA